ncbi:hypothetical protein F5X99DRAFT_391089 [Biscogniauxia marginata]|nr:hypothetical protein F5X99DRAFT_391089 [Biscogniauxia marginata]
MAAPANKTIGDLNGKWYFNKTLSDSFEPALRLQGVSWLVRTAIGASNITLHVRHYLSPPSPEASDAAGAAASGAAVEIPHVDIEQVATGGVRGTTENRTADFTFREHTDWLFGRVRGRCKFLTSEELAAFLADEDAAGKGWVDGDEGVRFLLDGWLVGPAEAAGPFGQGRPLFLSHVENLDESGGWTATQVWGFQDVGGERRYARNVITAKEGKFVSIKMVYDWVPEQEE